MGILPIEAQIDLRIFSLLRNCLQDGDQVEAKIARRQISMKDSNSNSWFIYTSKRLDIYDLPPIVDLLDDVPSKVEWKKLCKENVIRYWLNYNIATYSDKSSLRYCSEETLDPSVLAPVWKYAMRNPRETMKARTKAKAIIRCLRLQVHESLFYKVSGICPFCKEEVEDRQHFLLKCKHLEDIRKPHMIRLSEVMKLNNLEHLLKEEDSLIQTILDVSSESLNIEHQLLHSIIDDVEDITRNLIYYLYVERLKVLNIRRNSKFKKHKSNTKDSRNYGVSTKQLKYRKVSSTTEAGREKVDNPFYHKSHTHSVNSYTTLKKIKWRTGPKPVCPY